MIRNQNISEEMVLYAWGSDASGELGKNIPELKCWRFHSFLTFVILSGLGGTGIEQDETINCPLKMQWEEAENLKQAALGGQVKWN